VAQKNKELVIDEQSKEYWRWRDSILMYEELMLEILTFDLMVANPYEQLWNHLRKLDLVHAKPLREAAWTFCNDAGLSALPLLMDATDIAMASVFFASIATKSQINDVKGEAWWRYLGGNEEQIIKAVDVMEAFYIDHPLKKTDSRLQGSPEFNLESTRRRGETILSQTEAGSSHGGTPMENDGGAQTPHIRPNGRADGEDEENDRSNGRGEDANVLAEAQIAPGGSDVALKAAANNLDVHRGRPNGKSLASPGVKRKSAEPDIDSRRERQQKRARHSEEDE